MQGVPRTHPAVLSPAMPIDLTAPSFWKDFIAPPAAAAIYAVYGRPTSYQRPGYAAFSLIGIPKFLSRLEDVNRGQFISMSYRLADFVSANFSASVTVGFSGAPASNGTVTFDGVTYTSKTTLDNSVANQFFRGVSAFEAAENLTAAINAGAGSGTAYSSATVAHPTCSAAIDPNNGSRLIVSYRTAGKAGNGIAATDSMSSLTLDSRFFYGGIPLVNDLITFDGVLYRVSDEPAPDTSGGIQLRLEKKAV
jgi:hypothetical protein